MKDCDSMLCEGWCCMSYGPSWRKDLSMWRVQASCLRCPALRATTNEDWSTLLLYCTSSFAERANSPDSRVHRRQDDINEHCASTALRRCLPFFVPLACGIQLRYLKCHVVCTMALSLLPTLSPPSQPSSPVSSVCVRLSCAAGPSKS